MLNQVDGLLVSDCANSKLLPFAVEASWVTGKWEKLKKYVSLSSNAVDSDFNTGIGFALLALHNEDMVRFSEAVQKLRRNNARILSTTTAASLQACHDVLLRFHVLAEVEAISGIRAHAQSSRRVILEAMEPRIEILGAFLSDKQYVLGLRRAAMQLSPCVSLRGHDPKLTLCSLGFTKAEVASAWLTSARLARKADFTHHAFNAVLHASQLGDKSATIEHSRILWKEGRHRKAIQSLEGAIAANAFQSHNYTPAENATASHGQDRQQEQNILTARV